MQVLNDDGLAELAPLLPEMTNVVSFFLDDPPRSTARPAAFLRRHHNAAHSRCPRRCQGCTDLKPGFATACMQSLLNANIRWCGKRYSCISKPELRAR